MRHRPWFSDITGIPAQESGKERWFILDARSETHTRWRFQRQEASITVAPGSKTVGKGLRDGADSLDVQETQQYRSLVGTALYVGQDRPETQHATKEHALRSV